MSRKQLLTTETFVQLAESGKIQINALLCKRFNRRDRDMVLCTPTRHPINGFNYKVLLSHSKDEYELRDIYTSDLVGLVNEGTFEAIIKL